VLDSMLIVRSSSENHSSARTQVRRLTSSREENHEKISHQALSEFLEWLVAH
jgi:hypothetical protein